MHLVLLLIITFSLLVSSSFTRSNIKSINLYNAYNSQLHNTSDFEIIKSSLVIRRGHFFHIGLTLNDPFNGGDDEITAHYIYGNATTGGEKLLVVVPCSVKQSRSEKLQQWDARIYHVNGEKVELKLFTPSNTSVGRWTLKFVITQKHVTTEYVVPRNLYILFNPWNSEDDVYMSDENAIQEYVINNVGLCFQGSLEKIVAKTWIYGQNKEAVFLAVMYVLEKLQLTPYQKASPVYITRALSGALNSMDDNGTLAGRWGEPYHPFTSPLQWTGSFAILEEYHRTNGKPVSFGQCWVFAALLTTVCRTLGIPSRPVTNYGSGHDTDGSLTLDFYFNSDGQILQEYTTDSIWNFHVWTEAWMRRHSLKQEYSGWQAIDATPQEQSDGYFKTGPAPVAAIKEGDILPHYDCRFVYSEVNSDCYYWLWDPQVKRYVISNVVTTSTGKLIVTKKIGQITETLEYNDITLNYKFAEGTTEERKTNIRALKSIGRTPIDLKVNKRAETKDIELTAEVPDSVLIGTEFHIKLNLVNLLPNNLDIEYRVKIVSIYYTANVANEIVNRKEALHLHSKEDKKIELKIKPEEYLHKLVGFSTIRVKVSAVVAGSENIHRLEYDVNIRKPNLKIEVKEVVSVGEKFKFNVTMSNPLPFDVKDCSLSVESNHFGPKEFTIEKIQALQEFSISETVVIMRAGRETFETNFNCEMLTDISGHAIVTVKGITSPPKSPRPPL